PVRNTALSIVGLAVSSGNIALNPGWIYVTISTNVAVQPSTNYAYQILQTTNTGQVVSSTITTAGKVNRYIGLPVGPKGTVYKYMLKLTATNTKSGVSTVSWSANDVKVTYQ
ncbi:hypothetical protein EBR57_08920, partial [bacterium]|nr:hypothetical protein [bacterium]